MSKPKVKVKFLIIAVLLAGWAFSGLGWALPLCNYIPPESHYSTMRIGINYRYFDDQYRDDRANISTGTLAVSYTTLFDSATSGYDGKVDTKISYNNGTLAYGAVGSGSYRMYLAQGDLFAFGSTVLRASSDYASPGLSVVSGTGYGHFRDVTPLAKAMRISEMLLGMGSISAGLDDDTLLAIAQEIDRRAEYPDIKDLVQKVIELINATGLVTTETGELGPVEALRIEEIIEETGYLRLCGWDVRAGIGYEVLSPYGEPGDFLKFAGLNYAIAPEVHSQFLAKVDFTSPLMDFESYMISAVADYTYRINPRMTFAASHTFLRTKLPGQDEPVDAQLIDLRGTFHGEAGWTLTTELVLRWETGFEEWTKELTVAVSYTVF